MAIQCDHKIIIQIFGYEINLSIQYLYFHSCLPEFMLATAEESILTGLELHRKDSLLVTAFSIALSISISLELQ